MPVGAGLGLAAAATVYSGSQAASAAGDAADAQAKSGQQSVAYQRESRDLARSDLLPYSNFATGSVNQTSQPVSPTQQNFDAQAYFAANPDVANNWVGNYGKGTPEAAWQHYQMYGQKEGRTFTPKASAAGGGFAKDSAMGQYLDLLNPQSQANYLKENPLFQAALGQFNTKANNSLGFSGMKGDLAKSMTDNYLATGNQYVQQRFNNLLNPIQIGQASAAGNANNAITTGVGIGNTLTDIGNANAAGIIGKSNARTQTVNSLLSTGSQLAGAYYGA